jgi:hypothetical protein
MSRWSAYAKKAVRNTLPPYAPVGLATGQGTATRATDEFGHPILAELLDDPAWDAFVRAQDRHDPYRTPTGGEGLCL